MEMLEASVLDVLLELGQRLSLISGAVFVVLSLILFVHFIFICDQRQHKGISTNTVVASPASPPVISPPRTVQLLLLPLPSGALGGLPCDSAFE